MSLLDVPCRKVAFLDSRLCARPRWSKSILKSQNFILNLPDFPSSPLRSAQLRELPSGRKSELFWKKLLNLLMAVQLQSKGLPLRKTLKFKLFLRNQFGRWSNLKANCSKNKLFSRTRFLTCYSLSPGNIYEDLFHILKALEIVAPRSEGDCLTNLF